MTRGARSLGRAELRDRVERILQFDRERAGLSPADREPITYSTKIEMEAVHIRNGLTWGVGSQAADTTLIAPLGEDPWGAWQAQRNDTGAPLVTRVFPLHRLGEVRALGTFILGMRAMHKVPREQAGGRFIAPLWRIDGTLLAYSMPAQPGRSLANGAHRNWTAKIRLHFLVELIEGVAALHRAGYVHGNLKPSNVLLDQVGRPHVSDCGSPGVPQNELDEAAVLNGRFPFVAPEVGRALVPPGYRADVYALGRVAHMVAAGLASGPRLPAAFAHHDPGTLPKKLSKLIARATEWDPEDRYTSAIDIAPGDAPELRPLAGARPQSGDRVARPMR